MINGCFFTFRFGVASQVEPNLSGAHLPWCMVQKVWIKYVTSKLAPMEKLSCNIQKSYRVFPQKGDVVRATVVYWLTLKYRLRNLACGTVIFLPWVFIDGHSTSHALSPRLAAWFGVTISRHSWFICSRGFCKDLFVRCRVVCWFEGCMTCTQVVPNLFMFKLRIGWCHASWTHPAGLRGVSLLYGSVLGLKPVVAWLIPNFQISLNWGFRLRWCGTMLILNVRVLATCSTVALTSATSTCDEGYETTIQKPHLGM